MGTACCANHDKYQVENVPVAYRTLVPPHHSSDEAIDVMFKGDSESEKTYDTTIELDATPDLTRTATPTATLEATLADLNGSWMYNGSQKSVGTISNGQLIWSSFHATVIPARVSINSLGVAEMPLGGMLYKASFDGSTLRWNDGEVWCRVEKVY